MIRGFEIEEYLKSNNLLNEDYIIIDDDTFDIIGEKYTGELNFTKHFVECNHDVGFQKEEYEKVLKLLNKEIKNG